MEFKKIISTILLIIWMVIIFLFSNEDAKLSQSKSDKVAVTTINTVSNITGKNYTKTDRENFIDNSRFFIRKTAHFTLYFILGVLLIITYKCYGLNNRIIIYSVLFCLIYAISDEIHQLFSNGRTFKLLDIIIDTIGGLIGSLTIYYVKIKARS